MLRPENNQIIYLTEREGWTGCEAPLHGVVHCDAAQSFSSARERWWFVVVSRCGTTQVHVVIAASSHRYTRRHCRPQRHRGIYASSLPPLAPDRSRHHRRDATQVYTRRHCRPRHQTSTRHHRRVITQVYTRRAAPHRYTCRHCRGTQQRSNMLLALPA